MVIAATGRMVCKQFLHRLRVEIAIHVRLTIHKRIGHLAVHCATKPIVNNITSKSAFLPVNERLWEDTIDRLVDEAISENGPELSHVQAISLQIGRCL